MHDFLKSPPVDSQRPAINCLRCHTTTLTFNGVKDVEGQAFNAHYLRSIVRLWYWWRIAHRILFDAFGIAGDLTEEVERDAEVDLRPGPVVVMVLIKEEPEHISLLLACDFINVVHRECHDGVPSLSLQFFNRRFDLL
jgi:hypothetical protein